MPKQKYTRAGVDDLWCEVTFKDGFESTLELIYNWDRMHMYRCDDCYLLVPYEDIAHSTVPLEMFLQSVEEAKRLESLREPDLGKVLYSTKPKEVPCKYNWKEVADSSS